MYKSVSIRPQHRCWGKLLAEYVLAALQRFQSAPSIAAGGNPVAPLASAVAWLFQSAPSIAAGGNIANLTQMRLEMSFNPPPASLLGETEEDVVVIPHIIVSIRPQHRCWGKPRPPPRPPRPRAVSIRPQHRCWGKRACEDTAACRVRCFNPPPASLLGETSRLGSNPLTYSMFQSAPSIAAGGNAAVGCGLPSKRGFNPPPASLLGETATTYSSPARTRGFNPPPASLLGETRTWRERCNVNEKVSIRPQHRCWGKRSSQRF